MSHLSKIFTKQPIDIPNRSGFDMSFENLLTLTCGTLVPVLCEEVIPNETYRIGHVSQVQLPPMATNFYGRIDLRFEAFFVPNRIVWGGWQNFWTMPENNPYANGVVRPSRTPGVFLTSAARGGLADYLGIKTVFNASTGRSVFCPNVLPFLAYHKIYDDWYRNSKVQNPVFVNKGSQQTGATASFSPWYADTFNLGTANSDNDSTTFADGVKVYSLRQRNWAKDYFTTAVLFPQASGDVSGSTVSAPVSGTIAEFSVPAIRAANVLQRWLDRNNVAGERYADQIKAQYGVLPSDAIVDRSIFLGSDTVGIYNRSVYQTAQGNPEASAINNNPYNGQPGAVSASSSGFKDGQLVDNFRVTEHGYIIVLASIVPHAYYSTGIRRQLYHSEVGDFAIPLLQGLGEQSIYQGELYQDAPSSGSPEINFNHEVFGYQQQYSEYKYHDDEVHGLLVDGESLSAFALQRSFDSSPELGTEFLQIPVDYLDQVTAVTSMNGSPAWLDCFIAMKKISPLSEYVIPTLGDLKNTHKETVPYRGRML